jgi:hypothetical protein
VDNATLFKLTNESIIAFAHLMWPIVTLVLILVFRKDLTVLLSRVRKGKLFGQELELDPAIQEFQRSVREAQQELPEPEAPPQKLRQQVEELDRDTEDILDIAARDPELGIVKLAIELETEVRLLAASLGQLDTRRHISLFQMFSMLVEKGYVPRHTADSLRSFWELRNRIVHGRGEESNKDVRRVLDIGLVLLKTIRSIPHEINVVAHPDVELFSDASCETPIENAVGLVLNTTTPGGADVYKRIFPTIKRGYYQKGRRVAWEWNLSKTWGAAWYVDPDTGEKEQAWSSAGEFVGRHVEDI